MRIYARLVVGAQQRRAVGVDQRMTLEQRQLGEILDTHRQRGVEPYVASVVFLDDMGLDILAAHIGRRVDMGDEAQDGGVLATRSSRQRTHSVAVLVDRDVGKAYRPHLLGQISEQNELFVGRRECRARLVRLRVERNVFQKTVFKFHNIILF